MFCATRHPRPRVADASLGLAYQPNRKEGHHVIIATRFALLAGPGMLATTTQASAQPRWACMTDDGYGRELPCSMNYKKANPNWKKFGCLPRQR